MYININNNTKKLHLYLISYLLLIILFGLLFILKINFLIYILLFAIFLLSFKQPLLLLFLCVICDLWLSGYQILSVNPRTFLVIILFINIIINKILYKKNISLNIYYNNIIPLIILFIWMVLNLFIHHVRSYEYIYTYLMFLFIIIFSEILITDENKLKYYIYFILFCLVISSIFVILEYFIGVQHFLFLHEIFKKQIVTLGNRPAGLSYNPIVFSYEVLAGISLLLSLILIKTKSKISLIVLIITFLILLTALFANATRSAILSFAFCLTIYLLLIKIRIFKKIILLILLFSVLYISIISNIFTFKQRFLKTEFTYERGSLFTMAIYTATQNPFGLGSIDNYYDNVDENMYLISNLPGSQFVTKVAPHNHFLNIIIYFGLPAFILIIWFFINLIKNGIKLIKLKNNPLYYMVGICTIIYTTCYIVNASFHNAGPIRGDKCWWYLISIILSTYNLSIKYKNYEEI